MVYFLSVLTINICFEFSFEGGLKDPGGEVCFIFTCAKVILVKGNQETLVSLSLNLRRIFWKG